MIYFLIYTHIMYIYTYPGIFHDLEVFRCFFFWGVFFWGISVNQRPNALRSKFYGSQRLGTGLASGPYWYSNSWYIRYMLGFLMYMRIPNFYMDLPFNTHIFLQYQLINLDIFSLRVVRCIGSCASRKKSSHFAANYFISSAKTKCRFELVVSFEGGISRTFSWRATTWWRCRTADAAKALPGLSMQSLKGCAVCIPFAFFLATFGSCCMSRFPLIIIHEINGRDFSSLFSQLRRRWQPCCQQVCWVALELSETQMAQWLL